MNIKINVFAYSVQHKSRFTHTRMSICRHIHIIFTVCHENFEIFVLTLLKLGGRGRGEEGERRACPFGMHPVPRHMQNVRNCSALRNPNRLVSHTSQARFASKYGNKTGVYSFTVSNISKKNISKANSFLAEPSSFPPLKARAPPSASRNEAVPNRVFFRCHSRRPDSLPPHLPPRPARG